MFRLSDILLLAGAWWLLFGGDGESSGSGSSGGGSSGGGSSGGGAVNPNDDDQGSGNTPSEESQDTWEELVAANECGWAVFKYCVSWKGHGWECAICLVNQTTATMYLAEQPSPLPTYNLLNGTQFSAFKNKAEAADKAKLLCKEEDDGFFDDAWDAAQDWWNSRSSKSSSEGEAPPAAAPPAAVMDESKLQQKKFKIVRTELNSQPQFIQDPADAGVGDIYSGRRF